MKRSYKRLSEADWKRISELYLSNRLTLIEISREYGVSVRSIQLHLGKAKRIASAISPAVAKLRLAVRATLAPENYADCAKETRAEAYADAAALQTVLGEALATIASDPTLPPSAIVRACDQAAVALERIHKIRRMVLGLSAEDDIAERPLPVLPIRELTSDEVTALREQQASDDLGNGESAERVGDQDRNDYIDDVVIEGD